MTYIVIMRERIKKNMIETYSLLVPLRFRSTLTKRSIFLFGARLSLLIVTLTGTHVGVKEAIHIRLHPNNINKDSGLEILGAN